MPAGAQKRPIPIMEPGIGMGRHKDQRSPLVAQTEGRDLLAYLLPSLHNGEGVVPGFPGGVPDVGNG